MDKINGFHFVFFKDSTNTYKYSTREWGGARLIKLILGFQVILLYYFSIIISPLLKCITFIFAASDRKKKV